MTNYVSILNCLSDTAKDGANEAKDSTKVEENNDELSDQEQTEVTETVEDLMTIQSKEILAKNLKNLVRENLFLKKQIKQLKLDLSRKPESKDNFSFHIDCDGVEDEKGERDESDSIKYWNNGMMEALGKPEEESSTTPAKSSSKSCCFNCGESGCSLADCPHPRDQARIAKNRREFLNNNSSLNSARYHEDEPQKFSHLKPGLPSSKLRDALGLRDDEAPRYIFEMRELGYPPGWLRFAQIHQSGINLYHAGGKKLDFDEEGEVMDVDDKVEYDISKLMDWPGFNSELPRKYRDDTNRHRVRRRSGVESLSKMKEKLKSKEQRAYVRKELQDLNTEPVKDEGNGTIVISEDGGNGTILISDDDEGPPGENLKDESECHKPKEEESDRVTTPENSNSETITETDTGTPICEIYSPFRNLPKYANFGKDMTEHIAFENLPNYTGTWDKMRGILKNVREKKSD